MQNSQLLKSDLKATAASKDKRKRDTIFTKINPRHRESDDNTNLEVKDSVAYSKKVKEDIPSTASKKFWRPRMPREPKSLPPLGSEDAETKRRDDYNSWKKKIRADIPLVTIHGIKGSVLVRSNDASVVWLTGPQAAGLSTPELSLPLTWSETGRQDRDNIYPLHTLKAVTIIPFLVGATLYDLWLKKAETLGTSSYEFVYDWRRSNCETTVKFLAYLQWISAKHDGAKVQVVAHSMGGVVCLAALNLRPELFHSVLFAAAPLLGGPGLLVDLHKGVSNGRNSRILAPSVVITFPSYYAIAPAKWEHEKYTGIIDKEGKYVDIDWYDVNDWQKYKLAFYADENIPQKEKEILTTHLTYCLSDGLKFRNLLKPRSDIEYPPITILASDNIESRWLVVQDGPLGVRGLDFDTPAKAPGDGRVPIDFTRPQGIPHEFYRCGLGHESILNDPRIPSFLEEMVIRVANAGKSFNPQSARL